MASNSRRLLIYAMGGLLLLTAVTGAGGLLILGAIRSGEESLRSRFQQRTALLERIRSGIYLSGTLARDYFVDPVGKDAPALLRRLEVLEADAKASWNRYGELKSSDGSVQKLRAESVAYWRVLNLMTELARKQHTNGLDAYFRAQLAQRRETMLQIASDLEGALQGEWRLGEAELNGMYSGFRAVLSAELVLVIALGLLLSIAAIRRLGRLEAETHALSARILQVQEQERKTIARELHDEIGQALTALSLEIGNTAPLVESPELRGKLGAIGKETSRMIEEVRRIALSLRPSMLDDLGLVAALEWQAREVGQRAGLAIEVHAPEDSGDLPEGHRTCIYRITQEALQNSVRHAGATRVRIGLERNAQMVSVQVNDNGSGFAAGRTRGLGLLGMEERVEQLGGRFRVLSTPGSGTTVRAELPL